MFESIYLHYNTLFSACKPNNREISVNNAQKDIIMIFCNNFLLQISKNLLTFDGLLFTI